MKLAAGNIIFIFICALPSFVVTEGYSHVVCVKCDSTGDIKPLECAQGTYHGRLAECPVATMSCLTVVTFDKHKGYKWTVRSCGEDSSLAGISASLTKNGSVEYAPSGVLGNTDLVTAESCLIPYCNEKNLARPTPAAAQRSAPQEKGSDSGPQVHAALSWFAIIGTFAALLVM